MKFLPTLLFFCCFAVRAAGALTPQNLTCEFTTNPLGIDRAKPLLGWTLASPDRAQRQSAYEIQVSTDVAALRQGMAAAWSSGKVKGDHSINVVYAGEALRSFTRYYWRVRVYDQAGAPSSWSEPAFFETAMLAESDWKAHWIGDGSKQPAREEDYYKPDRMPLLRKAFKAAKTVATARLYISGVGYYEAYINGRKVSDHVLDPGWTTYGKQVLYATHDITAMLAAGNNVAGIMLGSGWWNPLPFKLFGRWDLRQYQQTGRPCVKAEIHLRYTDGTVDVVPTDATWQTAPGPVIQNNVYLGEHYDARLEQKNWNIPERQTAPWQPAVVAEGPRGELRAQMPPPIRVTRVLRPVKITEPKAGVFIADMGQNFAGVARLKVKGKKGTKITLRYGEGLFDDGSLNVMTTVTTQIKKGGIKGGPGAPETAWQEDSYTLKGEGIEVWSPRFTFHGFQYVEVTGWPGKLTANDIEGIRMNSDLAPQGTFSCSNTMFNQLHEAIQWTFLSNVFSVQSDCPGREKMGYGADMVVSANAFIYNYDMHNFYLKAVQDFANEQRPQGGMTEIAPFTGIADRGYGDDSGPLGWQLAFPFLQKQLYDYYGDRRAIEEHYKSFQRQIDFLKANAEQGLYHWDISDHESIDPKPEAFSAAAFYFHHAALAAEFAGILEKRDDSVAYAKLAADIRRRIVQKYWVKGTGRFDLGTQGAQAFALWYGFSPEPEKSLAVLGSELERHGGHVASGIFGVKMTFDVLRDYYKNDWAYRMANARDYPGWGFMLARGATTLWESWEFPETGPSRNHPMFGSIDEWFYRSLLGINPAAPGFKKILLRPQPAGDLTWAKGTYTSVYGPIECDWKLQGNAFRYNVRIPANTTAEVWVPCPQGGDVMEGGKSVTVARYESGYAVINIGSGSYTFQSVYP